MNPVDLKLFKACKKSEEQEILSLIKQGANVNATDDHGRTPLYYAEKSKIVQALILYGANVNLKDKDGNSPLHHMVRGYSYLDILGPHAAVVMIITYGANISERNNSGKTAKDCASSMMGMLSNVDNFEYNPSDPDTVSKFFEGIARNPISQLQLMRNNIAKCLIPNLKRKFNNAKISINCNKILDILEQLSPLNKDVLSCIQDLILYILSERRAREQELRTVLREKQIPYMPACRIVNSIMLNYSFYSDLENLMKLAPELHKQFVELLEEIDFNLIMNSTTNIQGRPPNRYDEMSLM